MAELPMGIILLINLAEVLLLMQALLKAPLKAAV
jgi:hypothetical protein